MEAVHRAGGCDRGRGRERGAARCPEPGFGAFRGAVGELRGRPAPCISKKLMPPTATIQMIAMTATSAYPCRLSPTILPNARGVANGMSSRTKIVNQFVTGFGFSNRGPRSWR